MNARGFLAGLATYRHLQQADFADDETFIAWSLACMEGTLVNPWKNSLLNRRANLLAQNMPLPAMLDNYGVFQTEFEGKFLDPNEVENVGRALMSLRQFKSAREFSQEFDQLAEIAGQTGQAFLVDQFRRSLKPDIQEKLLRQNFATLQALQIAAIKWDDTLFQFKRQQQQRTRPEQSRRPPVHQKQYRKQDEGVPMDLDFTRLSPEELERRKKGGLCFKCGERGHMGRNCPKNQKNPKPQLAAIVERTASPGSEATYYDDHDDQGDTTPKGF